MSGPTTLKLHIGPKAYRSSQISSNYGPKSYKSGTGPKYYRRTGLLYIIMPPGSANLSTMVTVQYILLIHILSSVLEASTSRFKQPVSEKKGKNVKNVKKCKNVKNVKLSKIVKMSKTKQESKNNVKNFEIKRHTQQFKQC